MDTHMNRAIKDAVDAAGEFNPSIWEPGPYSQMLLSSLFRGAKRPYTRTEQVALLDGVRVYLDWKEPAHMANDAPIVVICHGVSGDSGSSFPRRASDAMLSRGSVLWCSIAEATGGRKCATGLRIRCMPIPKTCTIWPCT